MILTGLLLLALSGCGQKAQTPPPAPETPVAETQTETPDGDRNPTAAELGREVLSHPEKQDAQSK